MNRTLMRAAIVGLTTLVAGAPAVHAQRAVNPCEGTQCLLIGSAVVGYGTATIPDLGVVPDRTMRGVNLRYDLHLLSLMLRRLPILTYDAVFIDVTWGQMTSEALSDYIGPEETDAFDWGLGYRFLAGKRFGGVAVLGGLGWQEYNYSIGRSLLEGNTHPVIARVELGRARPIVVTAETSLSGEELRGARIDVPLFRRLNATAQYYTSAGKVDVFANQPAHVVARSLMLGFRSAELR